MTVIPNVIAGPVASCGNLLMCLPNLQKRSMFELRCRDPKPKFARWQPVAAQTARVARL
jgi:hypothetical protein